jgi:RecA-family ATPase
VAEFMAAVFPKPVGVPIVAAPDFKGFSSQRYRDGRVRGDQTYFCISTVKETNPRDNLMKRQLDDLVRTYAIVLDDIGTKIPIEKIKVPPTWILESSKGNFQYGYKIEGGADPIAAGALIQSLIDGGFSDPGAKSANRVMRLPDSLNAKPQHNGWRAVVTHWQPELSYTIAQLAQLFGVTPGQGKAPEEHHHQDGPDPVFDWLLGAGMIKDGPNPRGWYSMVCPWEENHQTPPLDRGTDYRPGDPGAFKCLHGSCASQSTATLKAWILEQDSDADIGVINHELVMSVGELLRKVLEELGFSPLFDQQHASEVGRPTVQPLRLIKASDFADRKVPDRHELVPNLIPARAVTMMSGDGGTGKSLLALQLAVAVTAGGKWLDQEVRSKGAVFFFTAEDEEDELHRRLHNIALNGQVSLGDLNGLHIAPMAGEEALLGEPTPGGVIKPTRLFFAVEERVKEIKPALVVIDTLADTFGGDEIKRPQARQFIGLLRGLAMKYNTSVLLLAHPSLSGMNSGSGMSGSTAWSNSVRSRLYFERIKDNDGYELDRDARMLRSMKSNYGPSGMEILCYWQHGVFITQVCGGVANEKEQNADRIFLEMLEEYEAQGRSVSPSPSSSYAPTVFARDKRSMIGKKALTDAMNRLFEAHKIRTETTGPPSKPRKRLVVVRQDYGHLGSLKPV